MNSGLERPRPRRAVIGATDVLIAEVDPADLRPAVVRNAPTSLIIGSENCFVRFNRSCSFIGEFPAFNRKSQIANCKSSITNHFFCSRPTTPPQNQIHTVPAQISPSPSERGAFANFVMSVLDSPDVPETRWPATISVIVREAG